jgi:hypothetical protein
MDRRRCDIHIAAHTHLCQLPYLSHERLLA